MVRDAYRSGGIAALTDHRRGGNSAKLRPEQIDDLSGKLRLYTAHYFGPDLPPLIEALWTVPDLKRAVEFWYSVSYQSARILLHIICALQPPAIIQPTTVFKSRRETVVAEFEAAEKTD